MLVQRVADFVDGLSFGGHPLAILKSLGLEEEADLVGRLEEVFAEPVLGLPSGSVEDGHVL